MHDLSPQPPLDTAQLQQAIVDKLKYAVGKDPARAAEHDWFAATALALRDPIVDRWMATTNHTYEAGDKRVYYLSLEFLIGRLLRDVMANLNQLAPAKQALAALGVDPDAVINQEPDAALGNGGLGRLAACFMDSLARLGIPAHGYGIRYDYGLFRQEVEHGVQVEKPEDWLRFGNPWEFERPEVAYDVGFGGRVQMARDADGVARYVWEPAERVRALAYDTPVLGWQGRHVNTLRLWSGKAPQHFGLDAFNRGDYMGAVREQVASNTITRVLYPNDDTDAGRELRLKQEYFFTAASLQDLLRRFIKEHDGRFDLLPDKVAIQLNDTHPAIAVPELMRLLLDEHGLEWSYAWRLTQGTINYTNHTLLPEALEAWPVPLIERLLPRHMQIIYEINARLLAHLRQQPGNDDPFLSSVSLIEENHGRMVRMGHLAFVGAHKVNGVSALHSELLKRTVFKDLNHRLPGKITNKTNGITPRRWLYECNPALSELLSATIGDAWIGDLQRIEALAPYADDAAFRSRFAAAKRANKERLAATIKARTGVSVSVDALFDVQIKRIHEYKRQLLNVLETIALYNQMRAHPELPWTPRVKIFAGKAAASYTKAKTIIRLINDVARVVNDDPTVQDRLKVVFLPNYNVSLAEIIIPAADVSEQISTAGKEASGTGNMKFALNGALTIGTLDGANVEIRERVGADNIYIFGLTADEVAERVAAGYNPLHEIEQQGALRDVLDALSAGVFSSEEPGRYRGLVNDLAHVDRFLLCADFASYEATQRVIDRDYQQPELWWRKAVLNTARVGWFSSDRTIREYAEEIWRVPGGGSRIAQQAAE